MTDSDWGPLAGPWSRASSRPLITTDDQPLTGQCGCQTAFRSGGRWRLLLHRYDGQQHTCLTSSDDGLLWEPPQPVLLPEGGWEGSYALGNAAALAGDEVRLYYFGKEGICERVGLASSTDLVHWRRHPANPLFTPAQVAQPVERVFPDSVVHHRGRCYLFYDAGFDYHHPQHPRAYTVRAAAGANGVHFDDVAADPVLAPGPAGAWDDAWVCQASVLSIDDVWYMLYVGMSRRRENKDGQAVGLARATQPEGPWERYPGNPIFTPAGGNAWDGRFLQHPCPVRAGGQWRLYYTGNGPNGYALGLATSPAAQQVPR